ncbi:hypothetical protein K461DRAFT_162345 [Myriangium duriaei CBS 260.36]|uniref:Lysozyme inhibitor LprI N-terminal domain-containing protein n=1 Tax=Myriangium duriaei CBS 260.36 TaxID=1168546 RepID=A0A9P4J2M1_9PEZI|nr:hypothetical protein K461DRAFT_162345 [Myriangium duriaei CBS 260.36]
MKYLHTVVVVIVVVLSILTACSAAPVSNLRPGEFIRCSYLGEHDRSLWVESAQAVQNQPAMCFKVNRAGTNLGESENKNIDLARHINDKLRQLSADLDSIQGHRSPNVAEAEPKWLRLVRKQQSIFQQQAKIMPQIHDWLVKRTKLMKKLEKAGININTDLENNW